MSELDTVVEAGSESPAGGSEAPENSGSISDIFDAVEAAKKAETDNGSGDDTPPKKEEVTPSLLAGKYETPRDLEKAFLELQTKLGQQGQELGELRKLKEPPPADKEPEQLPDLAPDELEQLRDEMIEEHGEKQGTKLYQGFLKRLEAQRLEKVIDARVKPLRDAVEPVLKKQDELAQQETQLSRKQYLDDTRKEFGDDFEGLQKQLANDALVQSILAKSPSQDAIIEIAKTSPEKAHRMILWEIQSHNLRADAEKRRRSKPADMRGGPPVQKSKIKGGTIRDYYDAAEKDLRA